MGPKIFVTSCILQQIFESQASPNLVGESTSAFQCIAEDMLFQWVGVWVYALKCRNNLALGMGMVATERMHAQAAGAICNI